MTSAETPAATAILAEEDEAKKKVTTNRPNPPVESETEDEEVRMNCIGGVGGIDDSDMNTNGAQSEDSDCFSDDDQEEK
jgi:hypothetical protein